MQKKIEIDDFIDPKVNLGKKITAQSKLTDFSNIQVSRIDPILRQQIEEILKDAKKAAKKLKQIASS